MGIIENEVKNLKESNNAEHGEIKAILCEFKTEFKEWKTEADKRYAPKWVATLLYGLIMAGLVYILQAILKSIGV